jgi:tetratricopeptide (TPR) repeat protein
MAWIRGALATGHCPCFTGKHDDALAMGQKGVELNPSNAFGYWGLGLTYMLRGESRAGHQGDRDRHTHQPQRCAAAPMAHDAFHSSLLGAQLQRSAEVARLAVQRAPHYPLGWRSLANALGHLGTLDEAREALAQFLTLMPSYTSEQAARASVRFRDEPVFQHYLGVLRKAGWKG